MSKYFSIPLLGVLTHNKETWQIMEPYKAEREQSAFVRKAIIDFACNEGWENNGATLIDKPNYIPQKIWDKVLAAQEKSYHVDYQYMIAFYWLKSQPEFTLRPKSELVREIILSADQ